MVNLVDSYKYYPGFYCQNDIIGMYATDSQRISNRFVLMFFKSRFLGKSYLSCFGNAMTACC